MIKEVEEIFEPVIDILKRAGCSTFTFHYPASPRMCSGTYISLTCHTPKGALLHCGIKFEGIDYQPEIDKLIINIQDVDKLAKKIEEIEADPKHY